MFFFKEHFIYFYLLILAVPHGMWDLSSSTKDWIDRCPMQWKCGVLTTGPPGKPLLQLFNMPHTSPSGWSRYVTDNNWRPVSPPGTASCGPEGRGCQRPQSRVGSWVVAQPRCRSSYCGVWALPCFCLFHSLRGSCERPPNHSSKRPCTLRARISVCSSENCFYTGTAQG